MKLKLFLLFNLIVSGSLFAQKSEPGFTSIFNGKNLDGWKGDSVYWRVENGILTGEITPATIVKKNSFIIWQGEMPSDFELKVEYRVTSKGNSGINYRSEMVPGEPYALKGYQADIDGINQWTGQNYEERGRTFLALRGQRVTIEPNYKIVQRDTIGSKDALAKFIKQDDWNEFHLIIKGNKLQHYINGKLMSEVIDEDTGSRKYEGKLGVQVHVGPPMKIEYKNFRIKKL